MKQLILSYIFLQLCSLSPPWGFYAHKLINENAVYALPADLNPFYKKHIYRIREHAVNADKRVYVDSAEGKRHFIDLDRIDIPKDSLMLPWYKVREKQDMIKTWAVGMVPWQVEITYQRLVWAFQTKDVRQIIRHSADLGHYMADAHVPLHTTSNYNGQFSNQIGIHALWETRIPEKYAKDYNLFVGKAEYIDRVSEYTWQIIQESHELVDSVFILELQTREDIPRILHKAYIPRGNRLVHNYSDEYVAYYHGLMNGMVERRLRGSIKAIASLWFSAWVDAGQPDLQNTEQKLPKEKEIDIQGKTPLGRKEWH